MSADRSGVTFEQSNDWNLVRDIVTDPRAWRRMVEDGAPLPESFHIPEACAAGIPVIVRDRAEVLGFYLVVARPENTAEIHCCFLPHAWGRTLEISRDFVDWMFRQTTFGRLVGPVPSYNRLMRRLAIAAGFRECGLQRAEGTRRGEPFDLILMERLRKCDSSAPAS